MLIHAPHNARRRWLTLTALLVAALPLGWSHSARADAITDWSAIAQTAIVTNAGRPPSGTIVDVAYVFAAVYDAVNAIDGRYTAFAVSVSASPTASQDAAAAAAAHHVLKTFFPTQQAFLDGALAASMAAIPRAPPGIKATPSESRSPRHSWRCGPMMAATPSCPTASAAVQASTS